VTKAPAATLLLIAAGAGAYLFRFIRGAEWLDVFWVFPPVLYFVLASRSSLQLGFRLVLPAFAFLFLFVALAYHVAIRSRHIRAAPVFLLAWLAVGTAGAYPHYLSFFNSWAGGPDGGIEVLSDSNLDWGQDLRRLRAVLDAHRIRKVRLAYFGTDNPFAYFDDKRVERLVPPWTPEMATGTHFNPAPGYYAISATLLTGQLFPEPYRDYYSFFRPRKPIAKAGYSIYVYRVE
jgi:hypothetical protein